MHQVSSYIGNFDYKPNCPINVFVVRNRKNEDLHRISIFKLVQVSNFYLKQPSFYFLDKIYLKRVVLVQNKVNEDHHKTDCIFYQNFILNRQIWIFKSSLPQKIYLVQNKKVTIATEFTIFKLVRMPNFILNKQF